MLDVCAYVKDGRLYAFVIGKKHVINLGRFTGSIDSAEAVSIVARQYRRAVATCQWELVENHKNAIWLTFGKLFFPT